MKLRIATRKSRLALWQAEHVASGLRAAHPELTVELVPLSTRGDEVLDRSLAEIGGKGLFLKELERAMLDGQADLAVHSLKDVPAEMTPGLDLPVCLERAEPADAWLAAPGQTIANLAPGSRVGTSSLRRQAQLLQQRPDLKVVPLRGNVETRIRRWQDGHADAIILAAAGLSRLGLDRYLDHLLEMPAWLPAPGQGIIAVQCRAGDRNVIDRLQCVHCDETALLATAERAVVATLGGDCRMPLAALARRAPDGALSLVARLGSPDGRQVSEKQLTGPPDQAAAVGAAVAQDLLDQGGREILEKLWQ